MPLEQVSRAVMHGYAVEQATRDALSCRYCCSEEEPKSMRFLAVHSHSHGSLLPFPFADAIVQHLG